jgi:hypothetical protein
MYSNRTFSLSLQKTLNLPVKIALFERNLSLRGLTYMLNQTRYKYTYSSLNAFMYGINSNSLSFNYVSNIYEALNLPQPTPQYLYESFLRWEEIKAFKLERRNTNRIKKGLQPVTSISTRIK